MTANTDLQWYDFFAADTSHDWILVALYGSRALWATVGILFDVCLICVTAANKDLHHSCSVLIAIQSFFAIFLNLNYFVSFAVAATGQKFIPYSNCFPIIFPCGVFAELAQFMMLLIGADRLLTVLFPFWDKKRIWCIATTSIATCLYGIYVALILVFDFLKTKNILISCSINEILQSDLGTIMRVNTIVLSVLLCAIYSTIWLITFSVKRTAKTINECNRRLIKSLVIIIGLNLFCILLKQVSMLVLPIFTQSGMVSTALGVAFSFLTIAVYSANGPILFLTSTVYRSKFCKHFKWLHIHKATTTKKLHLQSQVAPINSAVIQIQIIHSNHSERRNSMRTT